jgi:Ca2+-binding RTX toxin-like protein
VPQIGFFVDTKGINTAGEELALDVSAELADGSTATGTLGFLKMSFTESTVAGEETGLWGHFGLDIRDADGDGKWKIGEGVSLAMNASAFAQAHLVAGVETTAGNFLPSVSTTIHYTQMLGNVTLSTNGKASIEFGSPDVVLQDVTLNVGSLFQSFLADTLSTIHDIVTPLKPVVDLLLMEIPLGGIASPPIRFIDIARLRLPAKVVETMTKVLQVLDSTIKFLDTVDELASAGSINFGTFHLTEASTKNPDAELSAADTASTGRDDSALTAGQKKILGGPDQKGLDGNSLTTSSATKAKKNPPKKNFSIPVLEDPASLLSFIMGRGEVDLFWYDLPDLNLFFEYRRSFPVFAGLNVGLFGNVGVTTNFDFGFDTRGLRQWMDTDFDPSESWRIFNGFYLDDHGQENTSSDKPELVLNAAIGASVSLGIGGLVEAGVRGGLEATINFDLNDFETQILNDLPVGDGKLYGSELLDRLGHGVECLFDVDGQLKVFLEAFLWIGIDLGFSTITLFEASERFVDEIIVKFDWECIHEAPFSIAQTSVDSNGDKVLTLSYKNSENETYKPGEARHAYKVEALPINEDLDLAYLLTNGYFDPEYSTLTEEIALRDQLALLRTTYKDGDRKVIVVSNGLRVQVYLDSDIDTIRATGTSGNDVYDFKRLDGVVKHLDISMDAGDDTFNSTGDFDNNGGGAGQGLTSILINGGTGEDYINVDSSMLESGTYILRGGADNDRVKIGGIYTGYTGVTIEGGLGDDKLTGGDGPDRIFGGHDDTATANTAFDGFDFIVGNGGDDLLDGGDEYEVNRTVVVDGIAANRDVAVYSPLTGSSYAPGAELRVSEIYEVVNGVIRPFAHYDKMGRPIQNAPDVNGNGVLVTLTNTNFTARNFPGDVIDGGDGNDTIRGGHGFDQIIGGAGTNTIYGEAGNDTIEAGTGNVTVDGGAGDDVITWNYAPFTQTANTDLHITGGAGTRDQLKAVAVTQTTAALNNNTFGLTEATDTEATKDSRLTIGANRMLLDGIENVSLDGRTGDDTISIGSLLNTDIDSLDLQLGSDLAKMWSVQRDVTGTHQVFPANYGVTDTNPGGVVASQDDLREGQYFYRYDLADNGVYLFNSDGSPMLADVITPATVSGANQQTQTVALSDGLDRVTLYYGYDSGAPRSGYLSDSVVGTTPVKGNGVEIHAGMTTSEVETALESLDQVTSVSVTGAGTLADPWTITVTSANTDANGVFAQIGQIYSVQSYIGALAQRDDTRISQRFYRVSDELGDYLFHDDGNPATADAPVLVEKVTAAALIDGNRVQFLALNAWELGANQDAILWYGDEGIVIESGDAAATIAARMQDQLTGVTSVTVLGSGTATDPWSFEFVDATQVNEKYQRLELASGGGNLSTANKVTRSSVTATTVTPAANDRQLLSIPANASKITLTYGADTTAEIDLLTGGAAAIQTALQALTGITTVSIARGATATAPWIVSLITATKDANDAFLTLKSSVTSEMSAAYLSTLGIGNNSKIQTIDFGGTARGVITYGRYRMAVDDSMDLEAIDALFDNIEGDLNGSTVAVTGTYGNWTATFTAVVSDQTFERILFTTEEAVAAPTTVSLVSETPVNRQQSIVLPASATTIFYGSSGIDINSDTVTASILKAKLESLAGIRQAEVTGLGTIASPWIITLVDADLNAGVDGNDAFRRISSQAFTQSTNVIQVLQGGVSPSQFSYQRTLRSTDSATQSILLPEWQTYSTVRYGVDSVDLLRSMTAAEVEAALESLDSIRDVWVAGSGQIIRTDTLQRQTIPGVSIAEGMIFKYGSGTITLAAGDIGTSGSDQATKLQTKLQTLSGMSTVTVAFLDATSEFEITFPAAGATQLSFKSADPFVAAVPGVDVTETLQRQSIPSSALAVGTVFKYGSATATLVLGDIGTFNPDKVTKLQTKLRTITGMSDVVVTFVAASSEFLITFPTAGATELSYKLDGPFTAATPGVDITSDPWNIVILDANRDQFGNFMILETVVAVQKMKRTLDVTTTYSATTQRVPAAAIVAGTQFIDNTLNVTLAADDINSTTSTQALLLQEKLRTLSPAFEFVTVNYSTVGGNFYEVTFPASLALQYTVSGGSAVNATADEVLGNDLQFVPEAAIAANTMFTYNGVTVTLVAADIATGPQLDANGDVVKRQEEVQAALLQTRLQTHTKLKLVSVGYIAGEASGTGRYGIAMAIPAPVIYLASSSSTAQLADPTTITVGGLTLPLSLNGAIFRKDTTTKTVSLVGDAATVRAALIAELTGLNGTVKIEGSGVAGDPWIIKLSGYNAATPITVEYDFGQYGDVTPDVVVTPALAILNADVVAGTQILVSGEAIVLAATDISATRATQATLLETKVRTLTGMETAEVTYDADQFFINFASAETLDVQIISGAGLFAAFTNDNLVTQLIAGRDIAANSAFQVGTSVVTLRDVDIDTSSTSTQASLLQTRLRTMTALADVTVTYSAGNYLFGFANGTTPVAISFVSGSTSTGLDVSDKTLGRINIAANLQSVRLFFDGRSRIFQREDFATDALALADLQAKLDALAPGSKVRIDTSALTTLGYQITIEGYDPSNPLIVTIDHGDFLPLANNKIETLKVVQQRDEAGDWHTLTSGDGMANPLKISLFGDTDSAASEDKFIAPYMTIEQEGPRLIELPTWAPDANGNLVQTGQTDFFASDEIVTDNDVDKVTITGTTGRDYFLIGHEIVPLGGFDADGNPLQETKTNTVQINHRLLNSDGTINTAQRSLVITIRGIDLTTADAARDEITVDSAAGDDRLIAGLLPKDEVISDLNVTLDQILWSHATDLLTLKGGAGNDRIVGTNQADIIDSGSDDDIVTGGAGVDFFIDASGTDTLQEVRDLNFMISDAEFRVSGQERDLINPEQMNSINESEVNDDTDPTHKGIGVFEKFEIFGGAGINNFAVTAFTKNAWLDGTEGSDTYVLTLTGAVNLASNVYVTDSGTGGADSDVVQITGGTGDDTLHLDADTSRQEILQKGTGAFVLTYHDLPTLSLPENATAAQVRTALIGLQVGGTPLFSDVQVTRAGVAGSYLWSIQLFGTNTNAVNAEGKFFHIQSNMAAYEARVSRATVTRITSGVSGLLDGKPDIDAMFEGVAFETQLYNVLTDRTGSYKLTYNGAQSTSTLTEASTAAQVKAALESMPGITTATVTGTGTNRDPFRITLVDAVKDSKGNFLPIGTTNTAVVSAPMEIADAAAATRLSGSVATPTVYQRVFYDRTAEVVDIGGGRGNDTFIIDDSMAALVVSGDEGDDNFIIGRVIKTRTVNVDGQSIEVIDGDDGVTPGVSYNAVFLGGTGDDYFEVNHNVGVLALFGEAGDDTFFLKALLQAQGTGSNTSTSEVGGGEISAGAGDVNNNISEGESNTLINYLENNRVEIYGGSGFDTVVVAGTQLGDTFYIFTDAQNRQYLYGAGLKLENIDGVERLALVTGGGDDIIYLYGLKSTISLLINTGTGDDQVVVGGEEGTFSVTYPKSSAVYTVEQNVIVEKYLNETKHYNDLQFNRQTVSLNDKQIAFRAFYKKWVKQDISDRDLANVTIDNVHWALLEANLAVALKLYAQAIELATSSRAVRYLSNIGTYFSSGFDAYLSERTSFLNTVNNFEQQLQNTNGGSWYLQTVSVRTERYGFLNLGRRTITSSYLNWALQNGYAPKMPSVVDFEMLTGLVNKSNKFTADGRSLDQILFQEYLRPVVAYSIYGDMIRADQVRQGTGLDSARIANWGYEPDLYLGDLYTEQVPVGGWMPHISGEKDVWTDNWSYSGQGQQMFWDLITMFYDIAAPAPDNKINVQQNFGTQTVTGSASYRFDDLPTRIVDKILPANFDISKIAGVVRIAGGPSSGVGDSIIINARNAAGITATLAEVNLELADYTYNNSAITSLDSRLTHDDVHGALERANKETQIGVLEQLRNNTIANATVSLTVDTVASTVTLNTSLTSLSTAVTALTVNTTPAQIRFKQDLQGFVLRGQILTGASTATTTSKFSVDALDALLNSVVLREMTAAGNATATTVETQLKSLRDYLTLISVSATLRTDGYQWTADPGLRVYEQMSPNVANRVTTYNYNQKIWTSSEYTDGKNWFNRQTGSLYSVRFDPYDDAADVNRKFPDNDTAGETRRLLEITYVITTGNSVINGRIAGAAYGYDPIKMERAYAAEMDNYQRSYYTYSFYGVGHSGEQILEAVALRRLNDRDATISPMVAVDARSTLGPADSLAQDRVYLTPQNWVAYLDALLTLGRVNQTQRNTFAALVQPNVAWFTDAVVTNLIQTAFAQTLRTDISLPIKDGLMMTKTGQTASYSVDIDQIQDDSGFYLPKVVTINAVETINVVVPNTYVTGRDADSVYIVKYDVVTGLNSLGLWFGGFENVELNFNATTTGDRIDTITVNPTRYIDNLVVNTGDGADRVVVKSSVTTTLNVNTGSGADTVFVLQSAGDSTISSGIGNDRVYVNHTTATTPLPLLLNGITGSLHLVGGAGSDDYVIGMMGNARAQIDIVEPASADADSLTIEGSNAADMFLFRPHSISTVEINAQGQFVLNGGATRLAYPSGFGSILVHGNDGNDTFILDDTSATLDIRGDRGDDTFQIGQVFQSQRDANSGIANADDYFDTILTTQGFLSNGISAAASLYGGDGKDTFTVYRNIAELSLYGEADDDNFLVRAFVRVDPNDKNAPKTNINGGQGADFISYTVNAPVNISGGDGLDTLTVVGTEFGEDFVVTEDGIYGGGLAIRYDGIENLVLDAMSGNDTFFIAGSRADVAVTLIGGQGSDTFNIGGGNVDANGNEIPIAVVSNDLKGHSGLISHNVTTTGGTNPVYVNVTAPDVSVNVNDNEDPGVVILNGNQNLRVFEEVTAAVQSLILASYFVVLSKAPAETVRVSAVPTRKGSTATQTGISVNGSASGAVLTFDQTNWFIPQQVTVTAFNDTEVEGTEMLEIKHSAIEGNFAGDGDAYDNLPIHRVMVEVVDNDKPGVQITKSGDSNLAIEGGASDTYTVMLTGAPASDVTVTIAADGQTQLSTTGGTNYAGSKTLTFTTTNWNVPQTVTVQAINDTVKEGTHFSRITHTVSGTGNYANVMAGSVDMTIYDNDVPAILITPSKGSTDVIEVTTDVPIGGGQVLSNPDSSTITGTFGTGVSGNSILPEAPDNDSSPQCTGYRSWQVERARES